MANERPRNPHRVDIHDPDDLLYWSTHFRIGTDDLVHAVKEAGANVEGLEQYLLKRRDTAPGGATSTTPGSPRARR